MMSYIGTHTKVSHLIMLSLVGTFYIPAYNEVIGIDIRQLTYSKPLRLHTFYGHMPRNLAHTFM